MLAVLLGGLSMVSPFSIDTFFPAFHAMEAALHVDAPHLQQVITAYMVPFAFASLVHGPLSDAVGRRPVMIWGMGLYTVGSIACTLAPNYEALLAARVLRTLKHPVKILGDGEIGVAMTVHAHRFSASARQKIEAAGGTVVIIDPPVEPEVVVRDEVKRAASEARAAAAPKAPKKKPAADDDADEAAADEDADEEPVAASDEPAADEDADDEGDEA